MAAISKTISSNAFFKKMYGISITISQKFAHMGQINNIPALV